MLDRSFWFCFLVLLPQFSLAGEALDYFEFDEITEPEETLPYRDKDRMCKPRWNIFQPGKAEESYTNITDSLQKTAQWMDSFFGNPRQDEVLASSELRVTWTNEFIEGETGKTRLGLRGNLYLPRLQDKLQLVFEGEPDSSDIAGLESKNASSALRYTFLKSAARTLNVDFGLRGGLSDPRIYTRLWLRKEEQDGKKLQRITPSIAHDSGEGWEATLRLDTETYFLDRLFLRTTTEPGWQEKQHGLTVKQNFSLYRRLSALRYLAIDFLNDMTLRQVDSTLDMTRFRVRHRRNVWRNQLFLEVAPGLRFTKEENYASQLEITFNIEIVFSP